VKLPPPTLDRDARRQGKQAQAKRIQLDQQMRTAPRRGANAAAAAATLHPDHRTGRLEHPGTRRLAEVLNAALPESSRNAGTGSMEAPASGWINASKATVAAHLF
jgi:hypothetical protein